MLTGLVPYVAIFTRESRQQSESFLKALKRHRLFAGLQRVLIAQMLFDLFHPWLSASVFGKVMRIHASI